MSASCTQSINKTDHSTLLTTHLELYTSTYLSILSFCAIRMPTISSGKVLVTGANGFVATWVVYSLLEHGYSVRASVRSEGKGAHLCKIFASYGDKFELAIVPDITSVR